MIMPFGKHKGKFLKEIPSEYLDWLVRQADISDQLLVAVVKEWRLRQDEMEEDEELLEELNGYIGFDWWK